MYAEIKDLLRTSNIDYSSIQSENESFLTNQIITYIGNKRALLSFIGNAINYIRNDLGKEKVDIVDIFSGSGIVSRYLKRYSRKLIANDLEGYCYTLNKCYLSNKDEVDMDELISWYNYLIEQAEKGLKPGFITELYAPKDDSSIKRDERCFYTTRNAMYIDTIRNAINSIPLNYRHYFIAPLLTEASVKNNTSGVFKGFYKNSSTGIGQYGGNGKNALSRITGDIELPLPLFSNYSCDVTVLKEDAKNAAKKIGSVDVVYLDPPYNQHPYGSNYFMLNLINEYKKPISISKVSGIPTNWNRSKYNVARESLKEFTELCSLLKSKYLLISFNSEGFISKSQMSDMLSELGEVNIMEKSYNTYRGSRNLKGRSLYVKEYLYLVKKCY